MPALIEATPSSIRKPPVNLRDSKGLGIRTLPSTSPVATAEARAHSTYKSRFMPMPYEPEDARITGVTRSLKRRLMALNIAGSLKPVASTGSLKRMTQVA
jgi:hypothetical protein